MLRRDRSSLLILSLFLSTLGFFFAYLLYSSIAGQSIAWEQGIFLVLLISYGAVCLYPIYHRIIAGNLDIFEPPIWASITYGFAFGILGLPLFSPYAYVNPIVDEYYWLNLAFLYVILGMSCLWLGYNSKVGPWFNSKIRFNHQRVTQTEITIKLPYIIALYGIGLVARIYMIKQGLFAYLTIRSLYLASLGEAQILMHIENCCRYGLALAAINYFIKPSIGKRISFGLIFTSELIFGFLSGMKSHIIMALLIVSIVFFYSKKMIPKSILLALILTLILIYPFTNAYRDLIDRGAIDTTSFGSILKAVPDVVLNSYTGNTFSSIFNLGYQHTRSRLSMLESFSVIIKDISQSGEFWYGRYYVYFPILVFVPRIIWSDKPVLDFGLWFTQTYWNPNAFHSTAITYPGDFYLNFGLTGVLLGMFFTGIIYRFVYERFKMNVSPSALFIYIFVFLAITNHEGDFVSIYSGAIKQLIELVIISYFVIRKERRVPLR